MNKVLVKIHNDHIKGYGFISDMSLQTRYGVTDDELKEKLGSIEPEYELNFEEVFIPNGEMYCCEGDYPLNIPKGNLEVWVSKRLMGIRI